ncbi:MAG: hypothetical protein ABIS84_03365 [Arachnia sp.]
MRILAVSGSARTQSFNTRLAGLDVLVAAAPQPDPLGALESDAELPAA